MTEVDDDLSATWCARSATRADAEESKEYKVRPSVVAQDASPRRRAPVTTHRDTARSRMKKLPSLAKVSVAVPMPPAELEERLRDLVGPEGAGADHLCAFEFAGTVDGQAFRLRRISRGPLTRFVVPEVTGVIEPGPNGSVVRAEVRPTLGLLLPVALLLLYALARSGTDEARFFVPFALLLTLGLAVASLVQETGRARRFLEGLARPPGGA